MHNLQKWTIPTTKDVQNFIQGNWNLLKKNYANKHLESHIQEQAQLRALLCTQCVNAGKCVGTDTVAGCGCKTPGMFYAPHKKCPADRWGYMRNGEEWKAFKQTKDYKDIVDVINKSDHGGFPKKKNDNRKIASQSTNKGDIINIVNLSNNRSSIDDIPNN